MKTPRKKFPNLPDDANLETVALNLFQHFDGDSEVHIQVRKLAREASGLQAKLDAAEGERIRAQRLQKHAEDLSAQMREGLPMHLFCPTCGEKHIDVGEFATKIHHSHACQSCGAVWRPAIFPTFGVAFLPGFRNEPKLSRADLEDRITDLENDLRNAEMKLRGHLATEDKA